MKRLILLRHAKSSWDKSGLDDHDRPLAPRGVRAALVAGCFLRQFQWIPDRALVSSAARTQETWDLVAEQIHQKIETVIEKEIYLAEANQLFNIIKKQPKNIDTLMLVGHHPGMPDLAELLCASAEQPSEQAAMIDKFSTAALALIELDIGNWSKLAAGAGHLHRFVRPKDLV